MSAVIILGSSRSDGGTQAMVAQLTALSHWDLIDLNDYSFSYFDYEHRNINIKINSPVIRSLSQLKFLRSTEKLLFSSFPGRTCAIAARRGYAGLSHAGRCFRKFSDCFAQVIYLNLVAQLFFQYAVGDGGAVAA